MKKFTVNAKICRIPVIDMATGRVIAPAFTPYYDGENLSLRYLALLSEDGDEIACVPFSSLGFMTDVCTMVRMPETPYFPDGRSCTKLIGAPLTAKAGSVSLFSFGTIAETDVDENGTVISLRLNDGHSFLVPREDSPENANVNDAFASEAFNCVNDSLRVSAPARQIPAGQEPAAGPAGRTPVGTGSPLSDPLAEALEAEKRAGTRMEAPSFAAPAAPAAKAAASAPAEEKRGFPFGSRSSSGRGPSAADAERDKPVKAAQAAQAAASAAASAASQAASQAAASAASQAAASAAAPAEAPASAVSETPAEAAAPADAAVKAPAARRGRRAWWRNCIAPTIAMFIYFFVYFLFALFLSKFGL